VFKDIDAELTPKGYDGVWGDYDNDGDLDILLTGFDGASGKIARIYRNDNGGFSSTNTEPIGVSRSSIAWGDYDNDGDLDILLAGFPQLSPVTRVYRNNTIIPNTPPSVPSGLAAVLTDKVVSLSWNAASDTQTAANGLTYNLRVGTKPGRSNILSAMANPTNGYRRLPQLGNANHGLTASLKVTCGVYYWSVQAIDTAWAGSPFATEGTIDVGPCKNVYLPTVWKVQ
jgi:hypothetical protein